MARLLGYARISTDDQSLDLQVHALREAGVLRSNIYTDVVTGALPRRPGLDRLLADVRTGDTVLIWRLDRIGRSVLHLADVARQLRERAVTLRSLTDGVDTSSASGRMLYSVLASLAEFERELIRERVTAGMAAAKRAGIHVGRPPRMNRSRTDEARRMLTDGRPARQVAAILQVSEATLYRALRRFPADR
jgi:DNA invertase Pin-like site-specific DNA recombinase